MKQPELGRKIAELRKAKGLTQEELVERCNLNVRTIQRIESGEVMPRSYTVRVIFDALDFNYFNRPVSVRLWPGAARRYFTGLWHKVRPFLADLFNLKTNTMKKITVLTLPLILIFAILFVGNRTAAAQEKRMIRKSLETLMSEQPSLKQFNAGDMAAVAERYCNDACMMPDASPVIYGREAIKAYFEQLYASNLRFREIRSEWSLISDKVAIERGTWVMTLGGALEISGQYLTQWHYLDGKWLIENEVSRSEIPGGE
ncbi:MAG: helix-turn-helix domain-containing protein [Bacteroidota bacterium]